MINKNPPSISIVIPNYNGYDLLEDTISNAYTALITSGIIDYELIVSDDASTDASISFLATRFPEVILVKNEQNTGFSGNANRGIEHASKELLCLLNSDVHLSTGYFKEQIHLFENPKTFGVMGLIQEKGTSENQDGAKQPSISRLKIDSNKNVFSKNRVIPTLFLSGANAFIRTSYLKEIGGFNEVFNPYYSEDVDLGIRAWRKGWELFFQPSSICFHAQSSTIKKLPSQQVRIIAKRNKHVLHFLHLPRGFNWIYVLQVSIKALIQRLIGNKIHVKALRLFYRTIPTLVKQRVLFTQSQGKKRVLGLLEVREKMISLFEFEATRTNPS